MKKRPKNYKLGGMAQDLKNPHPPTYPNLFVMLRQSNIFNFRPFFRPFFVVTQSTVQFTNLILKLNKTMH